VVKWISGRGEADAAPGAIYGNFLEASDVMEALSEARTRNSQRRDLQEKSANAEQLKSAAG
jgi:hypothetical protein